MKISGGGGRLRVWSSNDSDVSRGVLGRSDNFPRIRGKTHGGRSEVARTKARERNRVAENRKAEGYDRGR